MIAEIDEALAEVEGGEEYEIFVTGHSLGGALTTLFGYELAQRYKNKKVKAISFASPRVGSAKFRERYTLIQTHTHYTSEALLQGATDGAGFASGPFGRAVPAAVAAV